ncbi:MAG: protein phosphatase 2C domain-containing protein [Trebonia sp.]|jgi:protein phosphatase
MTLALRYAIRSDVGLLREGNEDSAYAGPHLLAVADGMGGHAAGEVASAATITTIAPLDARHLGPDLVGALADAVATANLRLQELIISDPAIEGMGTTLTALLWSEGYAALCHIGDSRAYRLRNGQFLQITHDHTLVQSLVDEGKITEDDVATHPHRSLLLRALDGRTVAEPDLMPLDTLPGDRYLLCSDGLSGVVTEQTLYQTLSSVRDPDKAALQLVELAIRGGGPDNITCIVADVLDTQVSAVPPTWAPVFAGAAATGAPNELRQPVRQSSPATRAMRLTRTTPQPAARDEQPTGAWPAGRREGYTGQFDTAPFETDGFGTGPNRFDETAFDGDPGEDEDGYDDRGSRRRSTRGSRHRHNGVIDGDVGGDGDYGHRTRRRWPIVTGALVLLVVLLGAGAYGAWWYNQQQYYVGVHDGYVAIFRGTNQSVAGVSLSSLLTPSTLKVSQLGTNDQGTINQTISKGSVTDAKALITQLQAGADTCHAQWTALATWQSQTVKYRSELATAAHSKPKIKVPASDAPGSMPAVPDTANCAPAAAFDIPASALPAAAGGTAANVAPTPTPTPSPTRSASVKKSATPRATA